MSEQWMSIVEYARTFDISDMTVRRRIRTGKIQAVLKEGKYYIPMRSSAKHTPPQPMHDSPKINTQMINPFESQDDFRGTTTKPSQRSQQQKGVHKKLHGPQHAPRTRQDRTTSEPTASAALSHDLPDNPERAISSTRSLNKNAPNKEPSAILKLIEIMQEDNRKITDKVDKVFESCQLSQDSLQLIHEKLEQNYRSKIGTLEAVLKAKDSEVEQLHQKVQDLQLLISILERRNT
jgi:hypothetical protein